jgi:hypothetical protein
MFSKPSRQPDESLPTADRVTGPRLCQDDALVFEQAGGKSLRVWVSPNQATALRQARPGTGSFH